jgi:tripartite-type tricarboxylate transporter receptor subunit TctC
MTKLMLALATVCMLGAAPAHAQSGGMKIVISFPPGGPVDFVARVLADGLSKELNQTVVVDNRPGANGGIAAQVVAKAPPDGNTLWLTSAGAAVMNPALYDSLTYDMQRDFLPVALVVNNSEVLVVNPANPARSAAELVVMSKQKPDGLAIASSGIGSMPHLAMELMADSTKANLLHVPYKGAAPALTDVMGNQVVGFFGDIPGLIGFVRGGKLKALAIAAPKRHPLLPDVPTLDEQGIHGVESNNWYALFAPAKTPPARIEELNKAVRRVLTIEPYRSRLLDSGAEPMPGSSEELLVLVKTDTAKWGKIIKNKKIKGE